MHQLTAGLQSVICDSNLPEHRLRLLLDLYRSMRSFALSLRVCQGEVEPRCCGHSSPLPVAHSLEHTSRKYGPFPSRGSPHGGPRKEKMSLGLVDGAARDHRSTELGRGELGHCSAWSLLELPGTGGESLHTSVVPRPPDATLWTRCHRTASTRRSKRSTVTQDRLHYGSALRGSDAHQENCTFITRCPIDFPTARYCLDTSRAARICRGGDRSN